MSVTRRAFFGLCSLISWAPARRAAAASPDFYELDRFFIAGFQYHEGPQLLEQMRSGDKVALCAESENPHDPGALRLEYAGKHVGYVPRSHNRVMNRLMEQRVQLSSHILAVEPAAEPWKAVEVVVGFAV